MVPLVAQRRFADGGGDAAPRILCSYRLVSADDDEDDLEPGRDEFQRDRCRDAYRPSGARRPWTCIAHDCMLVACPG
jgi:hypothetical protein